MTTTIARDHYNPTEEEDRLALEHEKAQYTLWQMLGIWGRVTLPMVLLTWVVAPDLIPYSPLSGLCMS